jgi:hypothetical protein
MGGTYPARASVARLASGQLASFFAFPSQGSSLAAETHVVIHIQQVEPGDNILALWRGFGVQVVEVGARFGVAGCALFGKSGEGGDLKFRALVLRIGLSPRQISLSLPPRASSFFNASGSMPANPRNRWSIGQA